MTERTRVLLEIDEPMGPGVDFEPNVDGIGSTARRARLLGPWLGLDRGHLVDADDGSGGEVPVLSRCPPRRSWAAGSRVSSWEAWPSRADACSWPGSAAPRSPSSRSSGPLRVASRRRAPRSAPRMPRATPSVPDASTASAGRRSAWSVAGHGCPTVPRRRPGALLHAPLPVGVLACPSAAPLRARTRGAAGPGRRNLHWIERPAQVDAGLVDRVRLAGTGAPRCCS